jgi:hypothetical protein
MTREVSVEVQYPRDHSRAGPNQALEQTRDSVLRYGESVGCELLNFFVRRMVFFKGGSRA